MIFLGCMFKKEDEKKIINLSNVGISNAINTFQWNLINGLKYFVEIDIINVIPVGVFPKYYKKLYLKKEKWSWENSKNNIEIGSINIPLFKQYFRYRNIKKELLNILKSNEKSSEILIYSTYLPFLKAVNRISKSTKVTLIVTDLPEYYDLSRTNIFKKMLRSFNNHFVYKYLNRIDSFVLLTEQMKQRLNIGDRKSIVVEGIANIDETNEKDDMNNLKNNSTKILFYSGTLHYRYGIKKLLEAFHLIDDENYQLWICGSGEASDEIEKISSRNNRIKFYGYLSKDEVVKLQSQSCVLINPRENFGEYTSFSFPSKTIEYLLSKKPILMHKLDGIPSEYDEHIYYFNSNRPKEMSDRIIEICNKSYEERNDFANKAYNFVIEKKNSKFQAKKIVDMIMSS